jgi:hypothetical protein
MNTQKSPGKYDPSMLSGSKIGYKGYEDTTSAGGVSSTMMNNLSQVKD